MVLFQRAPSRLPCLVRFFMFIVIVISSCTQSPRHLDKSQSFQKAMVQTDPLDTVDKNNDKLMRENQLGRGSMSNPVVSS